MSAQIPTRGGLSVGTNVRSQEAVIPLARKKGVTSAHVVGKKLTTLMHEDPNTFWEAAQHEFGIALQSMSLDLMDSLDARLNSLCKKITRLETTTKEVVAIRDGRACARETEAIFTAENERAEKSLLAQWLQGFAHHLPKVPGTSPLRHSLEVGLGLDAVDFAFCRYALNVAISSSNVAQEKIIASRIPNVLVGMIDGANASMAKAHAARHGSYELSASLSWRAISDAAALVSGPSLMALAHLARRDGPAREAIAEASGILVIIDCMTTARQPAVLSQACRALSALALLPQNRTRIAAANGISTLVGLLTAARPPPIAIVQLVNDTDDGSFASTDTYKDPNGGLEDLRVTESVQEAALAAFTNLT